MRQVVHPVMSWVCNESKSQFLRLIYKEAQLTDGSLCSGRRAVGADRAHKPVIWLLTDSTHKWQRVWQGGKTDGTLQILPALRGRRAHQP